MDVNVLKKIIKVVIGFIAIAGIICFFIGIDSEDALIAGYILLGSALVLWIDYALATYFYHVATEKGYYDACYLWIPFAFSFVGYVLVAALPDRGNGTKTFSNTTKKDDSYSTIAKYKELVDSGIITTEEFEKIKKELLGL